MQFSWYGLLLGIGFSASFWFFEHILHQDTKQKISDKNWLFGGVLIVLSGILGARIYHLITDWHLYSGQPLMYLLATWNGGLGIYGAILGGIVGLMIWQRVIVPHISLWKIFDAAAIVLPLGQTVGRFGNFLNQELFGVPTALPWGIFISPEKRPPQFAEFSQFHPLFLYEALPNFILFLALFSFWRWQKQHQSLAFLQLENGLYLGLYALCYGVIRFTLDFARWDLPAQFGTLTASQWVSIVLIGVGLWSLSRLSAEVLPLEKTKKKKRTSRPTLTSMIIIGLMLPLLAPVPASAQTRSELDLTIQPSVVELSIQPGKRVTQAIELANAGTADLEVTLSLQDFTSDNTSGTPVLLDQSTFPYAELQNANIRLGEPFILTADSSQQIVLSLNIPLEAETKDWYFVLLAETHSSADPNILGSGASATGSIASNILVRVTPTEFLPLHWNLELRGVPKILDSLQSVTVQAFVTNESASLAYPDVSIVVLDWRGNIVYEETGLPDRVLAKSSREIFAGKQRVDDPRSYEAVPFTFDPLFAIGPYKVHATIRNSEGGPVIVEQGFLALPVSLLLVSTLFIALFFGLRAHRSSREKTAIPEEILKRFTP